MPMFLYKQYTAFTGGAAALMLAFGELYSHSISLTRLPGKPQADRLLQKRFPQGIDVTALLARLQDLDGTGPEAQAAIIKTVILDDHEDEEEIAPLFELSRFPTPPNPSSDNVWDTHAPSPPSYLMHPIPSSQCLPVSLRHSPYAPLYLAWFLEDTLFKATYYNEQNKPCPFGSWPSAVCATAIAMGLRVYIELFETRFANYFAREGFQTIVPQELDNLKQFNRVNEIVRSIIIPSQSWRSLNFVEGNRWVVERPNQNIMSPQMGRVVHPRERYAYRMDEPNTFLKIYLIDPLSQ